MFSLNQSFKLTCLLGVTHKVNLQPVYLMPLFSFSSALYAAIGVHASYPTVPHIPGTVSTQLEERVRHQTYSFSAFQYKTINKILKYIAELTLSGWSIFCSFHLLNCSSHCLN